MDKITKTDIEAAYKAGVEAGRKAGITLGIEMGIQHCGEVMSAELHRFKFPEGHEARWNYKVDSLRPADNSTFEFTYQTYEERVKERDAARRRVRTKRKRRVANKFVPRKKPVVNTDFVPAAAIADEEDHGYDELLAEEGIYMKK